MNVKFYMYFNGERIRTLDDLRKNFIAEDILEAYSNGQLERWLEVWRHNTELEQVRAITSTNARDILGDLIRIFDSEVEPEDIDSDLRLYDYLEERRKFREHVMKHGINELDALKRELEDVKQERDMRISNLKQQLEDLQQELREQKRKAYTPIKTKKGKVTVARRDISYTWLELQPANRKYRITDVGNCSGLIYITGAKNQETVMSIEDAVSSRTVFEGISVIETGTLIQSSYLYFYVEEV